MPGRKPRKPDQFFILTHKEAVQQIAKYKEEYPDQKHGMSGFGWKHAEQFKDCWGKLPGYPNDSESDKGNT